MLVILTQTVPLQRAVDRIWQGPLQLSEGVKFHDEVSPMLAYNRSSAMLHLFDLQHRPESEVPGAFS
jgi:hypothetical protein